MITVEVNGYQLDTPQLRGLASEILVIGEPGELKNNTIVLPLDLSDTNNNLSAFGVSKFYDLLGKENKMECIVWVKGIPLPDCFLEIHDIKEHSLTATVKVNESGLFERMKKTKLVELPGEISEWIDVADLPPVFDNYRTHTLFAEKFCYTDICQGDDELDSLPLPFDARILML